MPTFQLSTKSPSVPQERVRIFRLAPTRVSQKTVFEVARRFGLKGDMKTGSLCQDSRQTSYSEGSLELVVHHASHGLRFHDRARWQVDDGTSRVEFDDETAIRLAEGIIKAHSVVPLDECRVLRVTRLNVGVAEPRTGLAEHRVIDVGVVFGRVIDGIPVEGPGGKVRCISITKAISPASIASGEIFRESTRMMFHCALRKWFSRRRCASGARKAAASSLSMTSASGISSTHGTCRSATFSLPMYYR
jgi:hypothetical protein